MLLSASRAGFGGARRTSAGAMFAVGHPTALASPAVRGDAPVVALERDARAGTTALVTSSSLEIWRGSRRLGGFWRSPATVAEEGAFLAAKWRDGRNTLAVVAEGGRVYLYQLAFHDGPETVAGVPASRCDVSRRATLRLATPRTPARPPELAVAPRAFAQVLGASSAGGVPPLSPVIEDAAAANDGTCVSVAGDRDVLLVGTSTGHLVQFDWDRRDDGDGDGDDDVLGGSDRRGNDRRGSSSHDAGPSTQTKGAGVLSRGDQLAHAGEVSDVDFCGGAGVLAVVAGPRGENAAAAVLRSDNHALVRATAAAAGVPPRVAERLTPPRWCPGSEGATCVRMAPIAGVAAGVVAVGTRRGECLLYRLPEESCVVAKDDTDDDDDDESELSAGEGTPRSTRETRATRKGKGVGKEERKEKEKENGEWTPGSQPVFLRVLSLRDWGIAPRAVGRVADARWTPDGVAIAVGYRRAGLAVWTPGGCRLMCTLDLGGGLAPGSRASAGESLSRAGLAGGEHAAGPSSVWEDDDETGTALGVERVAWTSGGRRVFATAPARVCAETPRRQTRALQYEFATPAAARAADLGDGESASLRLLTCADGFLVLAGDETQDRSQRTGSLEGRETKALTSPKTRRVALPSEYVFPRGSPRVVCAREGGADVLCAGARGFVLVDLETEKARVFGDVAQEKAFVAVAAAWVGDVVAVAVKTAPRSEARSARGGGSGWLDWFGRSGDNDDDDDDISAAGSPLDSGDRNNDPGDSDPCTYSLRVYPKYHLDASSCLLDKPLPSAPLAVNAFGPFLLVALAAGSALEGDGEGPAGPEAVLYEVTVTGTPRLGGDARASLRETRRAAIGSAPRAILDVAPVPSASFKNAESASSEDLRLGPELALVWRAGGALALVDMRGGRRNGRVTHLAREGIERFWVVGAPEEEKESAREEKIPATRGSDKRWSFWTYGAEGTRAWHVPFSDWLPSSLAPAMESREDPELELDRESYPLCVRLGSRGAPAVAGCAQKMASLRLDSSWAPDPTRARFAPAATSQPLLPCVLRHLLRLGAWDAALEAARASAGKPHFTHALEWLLFSVLDGAAKPARGATNALFSSDPENEASSDGDFGRRRSVVLLSDAARLIREFPEFTDVVAAVARKTDAKHWPALFAVAGDPEALQARAAAAGRLRVAACYLLVVEALKGARAGAAAAETLYGAALDAGQYGLVGELTRFLVRPAVEAAADKSARRAGTGGALMGGGAGGFLRWFVGDTPSEKKSETIKPETSTVSFSPESALSTPRGARSVPGARGGAIPMLPAPLREALREHAAFLASAGDLGNLSFLSRETGFDVGCFFLDQSTRVPGGGAARLGDFPKALDVAADSLVQHRKSGGAASAAWAGAGAFLEQTARAGSACAEWTLVAATLLRRADALEEVFAGRAEVRAAWDRGVRVCVLAAEARGDARRAAFLDAFREEVRRRAGAGHA